MGRKVEHRWVIDVEDQIEANTTIAYGLVGSGLDGALAILHNFYTTINMMYVLSGAPYGDNKEGLARWASENGQIVEMRQRLGEKLERIAHALIFDQENSFPYQPKQELEEAQKATHGTSTVGDIDPKHEGVSRANKGLNEGLTKLRKEIESFDYPMNPTKVVD